MASQVACTLFQNVSVLRLALGKRWMRDQADRRNDGPGPASADG